MPSSDRQTLDAYDRAAASFAEEWSSQPAPNDLYDIIGRFFRPGPSADIGCGSGRDAAWLNAHGFPATGFDGSEGLLTEARRRHPDIAFHHALLPELAGVAARQFTNVLCETVIMHLPPEAVAPSVARLLKILAPGGTLYLSWRLTEGVDQRDPHGRLYAAFDPAQVYGALADTEIVLDEQPVSASSGKVIRRVVSRKRAG